MRKSIALACILKNEINNIDQLLKSIDGCFDEIHMTDTGSDDGSKELLEEYSKGKNPANTKLFLHHFKWCDDFSKARNASFSKVHTDYIMWMDLDDVLSSTETFKYWRDNIMEISDFWVSTYHYASNSEGVPTCSFARERVVKKDLNTTWKYFVHEGMIPPPHAKINYAVNWQVIHKRTEDDIKKDRSRNIQLFRGKDLDTRMKYYFGKELFENGQTLDAYKELLDAAIDPALEMHDRIMAIQYAVLCSMQLNQFERAIDLAHQGIKLDPQRAEFFVAIGDSYVKLNKFNEAIPFYRAATFCPYRGDGKVHGAIFSHKDSYTHYPLNQLSRIYANIGDINKAEELVNDSLKLGHSEESLGILKEVTRLKDIAGISIHSNKKKTGDVVISCHPNGFYEWDEEIYENRGIGGSETAVCEIAKHVSLKTGRNVIVFNNREKGKSFANRHYRPAAELPKYFQETTPFVNINWRHNIRVTDAPTYLWCHDLGCEGIDKTDNYERVICLSNFHRDYVHSLFGVPLNKIWVSRNGIEPKRFQNRYEKDVNKIIYSSSPDRGLDRAMLVMDKVVKVMPDAKLHCFYGFDNMLKMGLTHEVKRLEAMVSERPYVKYYGNISQTELTREMGESALWLYPTNFLETHCITAVEAICSQTYPVVRSYGALKDTLLQAKINKMCDMLEFDCSTESEIEQYALAVVDAMQEKKWERIKVLPETFSWESVAVEWIEKMGL